MTTKRRGVAVYMRLHKDGRKRLAKLLLIQEVTHRELAQAVGWESHAMVAHLISGRRQGVRPEAALKIARYLGVDVADLFTTEIPTMNCQRKTGSRSRVA